MRTNINLDDQLLMQAQAAASSGITLERLIEEGRPARILGSLRNLGETGRVRLIIVQGTGTRPSIDLDNSQITKCAVTCLTLVPGGPGIPEAAER